MPNWCRNRLSVAGPHDQIDAFARRAALGKISYPDALEAGKLISEHDAEQIAAVIGQDIEGTFSFRGHVPEPVYADEGEWHPWRIANWGTKWDAAEPEMSFEDGELVIEFDTAWSPPEQWLRQVASEHPELKLEMLWNEEQCFAGKFEAHDGVCDYRDLTEEELVAEWPDAPFRSDEDEH